MTSWKDRQRGAAPCQQCRLLPSEHKESRLVADHRDVPLAGRCVFQPKHLTDVKLSRLAIGRADREDPANDREKLRRRSGVIETLLQILGAPMRLEPREERARGGRIAADIDRRRGRRKVHLAKFDGHILKMRFSVRGAVKTPVSEMRWIGGVFRIDRRLRGDYGEYRENKNQFS